MNNRKENTMKKTEQLDHLAEKKKEKNTVGIITCIVSIVSLAVSIFNFLFSTYPYLNARNSDVTAKAMASDPEAQLFLAHHYYTTHNYQDSIYWYKTLAANEFSNYFEIANNNLACVLSLYSEETGNDYYDDVMDALLLAANNRNSQVLHNISRLLACTDSSNYAITSYDHYCEIFDTIIKNDYHANEYKEERSILNRSWQRAGTEELLIPYLEYYSSPRNRLNESDNEYYVYISYHAVNTMKMNERYELVYLCDCIRYEKTENSFAPLSLSYYIPSNNGNGIVSYQYWLLDYFVDHQDPDRPVVIRVEH